MSEKDNSALSVRIKGYLSELIDATHLGEDSLYIAVNRHP